MLNESEIREVVIRIMEENEIYRNLSVQKYFSLKRFLSSLKTNNFTFQKPSTWEDPFEDFMSKLVNYHNEANYHSFEITNNIYALSTINKKTECDGMWSNFAQKNGILIHIRVEEFLYSIVKYLLDNHCCNNKELYDNNYHIINQLVNCIKIKKIKYLTDEKIALKFRRTTKTLDNDFHELSYKMLSIKRKEFEYENEYRFFVNQELLKLKEIKFLPMGYLIDSIEKIIISPRAKPLRESRLKNLFINKYKINCIIEKSNLYNIQHFKDTYNL
jgi:hypothetical protein